MAASKYPTRSSRIAPAPLLAGLLALCSLLFGQTEAIQAAGTQYYVDSAAGSDSNNGTSSSSPWKSLSAVANRTFSAGDTINFKAGSSFSGGLTFKSSGTASAPIILQPYGSGARPVFSASGAGSNAIRLDANYVTAKGFLLKDAENGVRVSDSFHHNTIEDNEIAGTGLGLLLYGDYNRVIGNYIHDLKMVRNTSSSSTDDYGANGVMLNNSKGDEIAYNRFVNNRAPSIDYGYDGGAVEMWGSVSDISIHSNQSSGGQGFLEQGGGDVRNISMASNESRDDYAAFVMLHLDPTHTHGGTATNFVMEGNTIIRSQAKGYRVLDIQGSPNPSQLVFKNNLVYSNMSIARDGDHGHIGNKYLLVDGASVGCSLGSGETQQSGSGVNPSGLRYEQFFGPAPELGSPKFVLGFAILAGLLDGAAGEPIANENHNPENGDSLQQTTSGLMAWRKADNWTAFTNGTRTWVNGPFGVQERDNNARFDWEAQ